MYHIISWWNLHINKIRHPHKIAVQDISSSDWIRPKIDAIHIKIISAQTVANLNNWFRYEYIIRKGNPEMSDLVMITYWDQNC